MGEQVRHIKRFAAFLMGAMSLSGLTLVNTRPSRQAAELTRLLEHYGAQVVEIPLLEISAAAPGIDSALRSRADWLVFTSANGVYAMAERGELPEGNIAVIGAKTGAAAAACGRRPAFIAQQSDAQAFASEFSAYLAAAAEEGSRVRILLLRGDTADPRLPYLLAGAGKEIHEEIVYRVQPAGLTEEAAGKLRTLVLAAPGGGRADMIVLSSGAAAGALASFLETCRPGFGQQIAAGLPTAVIGPQTAAAARNKGFPVAVCAEQTSVESLAAGIAAHFGRVLTTKD